MNHATSSMEQPPETGAAQTAADITARLDRIPTGRFHGRLAGIVGTGTFFDGFDALSIAVILSLIVSTFKISFAEAGLIISAGYLGQFVGALVIGALSDRIGRRKAFVLCLAVFGLLSMACAFAWSADSLLLFRLIQGIGLGAEVPVAATLINEYLGTKSRGRISVLYQSAFSWGLFFAPLVALMLTSALGPQLGWRVLLGVGALPLLVAIWAWFAVPESARWLANKGRITEADAYVSRMESEAIARGHVLSEPAPLPEVKSLPFRLNEMFQGQYARRTLMLALVWFTCFFVVYGYTTWLPTLYVSVGRLPSSSSLVLTIILGLVQLVVVYLCAWLVERLGRKVLLALGTGIGAVGALGGLVVVGILGRTDWPYLFATGLIIGIGMTIPAGMLYLYTGELYPTRMRGFATSAASSLNRLASIISPFIIGFLLDGHGGAGAVFGLLGAAALVSFVVIATLGIETRNRRLEEISV